MPEKLFQAAIITFLLYLIAGLNTHTRYPNRLGTNIPRSSVTIVSFLLQPFK